MRRDILRRVRAHSNVVTRNTRIAHNTRHCTSNTFTVRRNILWRVMLFKLPWCSAARRWSRAKKCARLFYCSAWSGNDIRRWTIDDAVSKVARVCDSGKERALLCCHERILSFLPFPSGHYCGALRSVLTPPVSYDVSTRGRNLPTTHALLYLNSNVFLHSAIITAVPVVFVLSFVYACTGPRPPPPPRISCTKTSDTVFATSLLPETCKTCRYILIAIWSRDRWPRKRNRRDRNTFPQTGSLVLAHRRLVESNREIKACCSIQVL